MDVIGVVGFVIAILAFFGIQTIEYVNPVLGAIVFGGALLVGFAFGLNAWICSEGLNIYSNPVYFAVYLIFLLIGCFASALIGALLGGVLRRRRRSSRQTGWAVIWSVAFSALSPAICATLLFIILRLQDLLPVLLSAVLYYLLLFFGGGLLGVLGGKIGNFFTSETLSQRDYFIVGAGINLVYISLKIMIILEIIGEEPCKLT